MKSNSTCQEYATQIFSMAFGAANRISMSLSTGDTKAVRFTSRIISAPSVSGKQHGLNHGAVSPGKTPTEANDPSSTSDTAVSTATSKTSPTNPHTIAFTKAGIKPIDAGGWTMLFDLPALFAGGSAALLAGWVLRRRGE